MNLAAKFKSLLPKEPTLVGEITSHNADGTSTITTPSGGTINVPGQDVAVGNQAFYTSDQILGQAQNLTAYTLEV